MTTNRKLRLCLAASLVTAFAAAGWAWAQGRGWRGREATSPPAELPVWEVDSNFVADTFTFARVRYTAFTGGFGIRPGERWAIDYPDAEMNLGFRLQQLTSMRVNPQPKALDLTDLDLGQFPFIYIVEPGALEFTDAEVSALRHYLLNGGFLMMDDFWGRRDWENVYREIRRVFPDREPQELSTDHPIFSCVFPLKEKPQVPGIHHFYRAHGTPYEAYEGRDAAEVHYKALYDDRQRMVGLLCHNTDLGDGWEREGENVEYFHKYSETKCYPMAINILYYAMTH